MSPMPPPSASYVLRSIQPEDHPFLWDMLFEAASVSQQVAETGKDAALKNPDLRKYLDDWGRAGDAGVVAIGANGERLGAAWFRLFPRHHPGYGFVSDAIPELSIAVVPSTRGIGLGTTLLQALIQVATDQGFRALSLSVDRENPALRLYQRVGFRDAQLSRPGDSSVTLIHDSSP